MSPRHVPDPEIDRVRGLAARAHDRMTESEQRKAHELEGRLRLALNAGWPRERVLEVARELEAVYVAAGKGE
jgi:hypothetical protein